MNEKLRSMAALIGWMLCAAAAAQQYPNKAVRLMPDEFRAQMKADLAKWAQAVKDANIPTLLR